MALITNPLMSLDASGSIAGAITFSKWKGRNYVRQLVTPANPRSAGQINNRAMMQFLSRTWALNTALQPNWLTLAKQKVISSFNAFVAFNQAAFQQAQWPYASPTGTPAGTAPTLAAPTITGGVRQITFTDVVTTIANGWGLVVQISATTVAPGAANVDVYHIIDLTGVVNGGTVTAVIGKLAPATYRVTWADFTTTGKYTAGSHTDGIVVT